MKVVKKIITLVLSAAVLVAAGGVAYADANGAFQRETDQAKMLVNKYMDSVMRSYKGEEDVSFYGIVKEGCDFWYYNDYNNDIICSMSSGYGNAEIADNYVTFGKITYSGHCYRIEARVDQMVKYKDVDDIISTCCLHTFMVEQDGKSLYIINDISDGSDKILAPAETEDTPSP